MSFSNRFQINKFLNNKIVINYQILIFYNFFNPEKKRELN